MKLRDKVISFMLSKLENESLKAESLGDDGVRGSSLLPPVFQRCESESSEVSSHLTMCLIILASVAAIRMHCFGCVILLRMLFVVIFA